MTTDRELLELAAKAAGIEIIEWSCIEESCDAIARLADRRLHKWNPLTDDGDALRLAVKLNIPIFPYEDETSTGTIGVVAKGFFDKYENTRRAIVRAAAAI